MSFDSQPQGQEQRLMHPLPLTEPTGIRVGLTSHVALIPSQRNHREGLLLGPRDAMDTQVIPLINLPNARYTVGRDPNGSVRFSDTSVSRNHLVIHSGTTLTAQDSGSMNGSYAYKLREMAASDGKVALPFGQWAIIPENGTTKINSGTNPHLNGTIQRTNHGVFVEIEGRWTKLEEAKAVTIESNPRIQPTATSQDDYMSFVLYEGKVIMGNFSGNNPTIEHSLLSDMTPAPDTSQHHTPHHPAVHARAKKAGFHFHFPGIGNRSAEQAEQLKQLHSAAHTIKAAYRDDPASRRSPDNEDAVIAMGSFIATIDGMGGKSTATHNGRDAAALIQRILTNEIRSLHQKGRITASDVKKTYQDTWSQAKKAMPDEIGAVLAVAQDVGDKIVYAHSGDARVGVVKDDGRIVWLTEDEGLTPSRIVKIFDEATHESQIRPYQREWNNRNQVYNAIQRGSGHPNIKEYVKQPNDRFVITSSDGNHENLAKSESEALFRDCIQKGYAADQIVRRHTTAARVRSTDGTFRARPDDMGMAIMDLQSAA